MNGILQKGYQSASDAVLMRELDQLEKGIAKVKKRIVEIREIIAECKELIAEPKMNSEASRLGEEKNFQSQKAHE